MDGSVNTLLLFAIPALAAGGAAAITAVIMQAHSECVVARHRVRIAELQVMLDARDKIAADRIRAVEEAARRRALDEVIGGIRVEERQFRQGNSVLLQERVFFRTVPLTGWIEHELIGPAAVPAPAAALRAIEPPRIT